MTSTVLATIQAEDFDDVAVVVAQIATGFSVTIWDLDVEMALPSAHLFAADKFSANDVIAYALAHA
jgi:hypothetical protein